MQALVSLSKLFFSVPAAEVSAALEVQPGSKEQVRLLPSHAAVFSRREGPRYRHPPT
jgi:hypothetical protein